MSQIYDKPNETFVSEYEARKSFLHQETYISFSSNTEI